MIIRSSNNVKCPSAHKLCTSGLTKDCEKQVCRAFFPVKQPIIMPDTLKTVCHTEEYLECQQYIEGEIWKAERKRKWLEEHCKYASNSICGKPKDWWCKGSSYPFKLHPIEGTEEEVETAIEVLKATCWTGDAEVHAGCPHYIAGEELRRYVRELKKKE